MSACARTFGQWRAAARPLLLARVPWREVEWVDAQPVAAKHEIDSIVAASDLRLSRTLMRLLECISHYRHAGRWELMYRLAWRASYENPRLLEDAADDDVRHATQMERAVNRECHKMHAFVRFREVPGEGGQMHYFAWFEPDHEILRRGVPFFVNRFRNMHWTIATPDGAAAWDTQELRYFEAPEASSRPRADSHETLWRTYYRSICNVARINPQLMRREMPQRYWQHLPEAAEIPVLIRDGQERFAQRHSEADIATFEMARAVRKSLAELPRLGEGLASCQRCALWRSATQAVAGEGPADAAIMLVGEQPGDEEDLRGRPFIGPAGKLLDECLGQAGLDRAGLFVTNAVKHFKWEPRGKRRLHKRPHTSEITACNVWIEQEVAQVKPRVIVALGATALRSLTGASHSIESAREETLVHSTGASILGTYHPAAILRADRAIATELRDRLVQDLARAKRSSREPTAPS